MKIDKIIAYIFRSWKDERGYNHPRLRIIPPFAFDLILYAIALSVIYQISSYLWSVFTP
jgi:hypothetical protein